MSYMALHNCTVLHCALERWKDYSVQLDCKHNTVEELQFYTGIQISRTSSRTSSRREHPLVSPPVRAMTGRGGGWGCPKRATRKPNLTLFSCCCGNSEFQLRIKLLSGGGVETLIVVEQHKRVGVNPAKREEGEYLPSNKTSTADLQLFTFRFADFLIPIFLCCSVS